MTVSFVHLEFIPNRNKYNKKNQLQGKLKQKLAKSNAIKSGKGTNGPPMLYAWLGTGITCIGA